MSEIENEKRLHVGPAVEPSSDSGMEATGSDRETKVPRTVSPDNVHSNDADKRPPNTVAWLALIASGLSIVISLSQFIENRSQNQAMLRPYLSLWTKVGNLPEQGLFVSNRGFGPAKLSDFTVYYRGHAFKSFSEVVTFLQQQSRNPRFVMATGLDAQSINAITEQAQHQSWNPGDIIDPHHESALFLAPAGTLPTVITSTEFFRRDLGVKITYCATRGTVCDVVCINLICPAK
jgi:hypothetical protein